MKEWAVYCIVGTGGFIGANARFVLGRWAAQKWGTDFPWGTFLINVSGSFLLGLFAALAVRFAWNDGWRLLIAVGFLGAFTTFSTFTYESLQLMEQGRLLRAGLNLLGSVAVGMLGVALGVAAARILPGSASSGG